MPKVIVTEKFLRDWDNVRKKVNSIRGDGANILVTHGPDFVILKGRGGSSNNGGGGGADGATRYKIKTAANSAGVIVANTWDGTNLGTSDVPILSATGSGKVGDVLWAQRTNNTGLTLSGSPVTWIEVAVGNQTSPTAVGGSGATADAATWSIAANATPIQQTIMTRVYYDSGTEVLYGFTRVFTFSSRGALVSVSAETRVTLDTLEAC